MDNQVERSFADSNKAVAEAFDRYMEARGMRAPTQRAYRDTVGRFIDLLGSRSVLDAKRPDIRRLQAQLVAKGLHANSIRLHTAGLRCFCKFLTLTGLTTHDPTLLVAQRKVPSRTPRVLAVEEVERLIAAGETPMERAVVEVLYSTGVRVSELVKIRLEDVDFENRAIRVNKGKGGKDRIVLFGRKAAAALTEYLAGRKEGFLFEHRQLTAHLRVFGSSWYASFRIGRVRKLVLLGLVADLSQEQAQARLDSFTVNKPELVASLPHRAYGATGIRFMLNEIAFRAGIAHVHPHSLRRAFATHLLANGANLRVVQELLGHTDLSATALYTNLSVADVKRTHNRCHPHEETKHEKEQSHCARRSSPARSG